MTTVQPPTPPPPMRLRELVFGAACAAAVRAAARLGVADALDDRPMTAEDLAAAVKTEPGPLRPAAARPVLLRRLRRDRRTARSRTPRCPGCCARTTRTACATSPCGAPSRGPGTAWPRLDEAVRTGRNVFEEPVRQGVLRLPPRGRPRVRPRLQPGHDDLQRAVGAGRRRRCSTCRGVTSVADIGGGQGHVVAVPAGEVPLAARHACSICRAWWRTPTPGCVRAGRWRDRVRIVPGDCREDIPVQADVYIIKNILEWDDESTRRDAAQRRRGGAARRPGRGHREPRGRHARRCGSPPPWTCCCSSTSAARSTPRQSMVEPADRGGPGHRRDPAGQPVPARLRVHASRADPAAPSPVTNRAAGPAASRSPAASGRGRCAVRRPASRSQR